MMRGALAALVDQVLLSALSFALALLLIRFASADEYGLYSQLLNLQSLFSVLHAGVFVSGLLAVYARAAGPERDAVAGALARADLAFGACALPLICAATYVGGLVAGRPIAPMLAGASGAAVVGLWWREFIRALAYGDGRLVSVLRFDLTYVGATLLALAAMQLATPVSAVSVMLATALGGIATGGALVARRGRAADRHRETRRTVLRAAWIHGRWDTFGSVVTWLQAQTYVYFAALTGGLLAAGTVSAARLLGMPLALLWAAGATPLRVTVANATAARQPGAARRALMLALAAVGVCAAVYSAMIDLCLPVLDAWLFHHKFPGLGQHAAWWLVYFTATGFTTAGAAVLRGTMRFAMLFRCYLASCGATLLALLVLTALKAPISGVAALVAGELTLLILLARQLPAALENRAATLAAHSIETTEHPAHAPR